MLIISTVVLLFSSCNYGGYKGDRTDLYTVAVNNVFGTFGHHSNGEVVFDPHIHVIETDAFGRTLFFYSEFYTSSVNPVVDNGMAFVIMQYSNDETVYYYQDECYLPFYDTNNYYETESDWAAIEKKMDTAALDALKKANDWNQEINEEKCASLKISKHKNKSALRPHKHELNEPVYAYEVQNGYTGEDEDFVDVTEYCQTDRYGKELFWVWGMTSNADETDKTVYEYHDYAVILNADGKVAENGIAKIPSPTESLKIVNQLKSATGWNTPT